MSGKVSGMSDQGSVHGGPTRQGEYHKPKYTETFPYRSLSVPKELSINALVTRNEPMNVEPGAPQRSSLNDKPSLSRCSPEVR